MNLQLPDEKVDSGCGSESDTARVRSKQQQQIGVRLPVICRHHRLHNQWIHPSINSSSLSWPLFLLGAVSLPIPAMEEDIVWEIGEIEAQGGGESPPLFDQATPPPLYPPASVSSLTRGDAAAASISNKRGRVAASSKAIQGLREVTAPPTDGSDDDCCAICLQDLDYSDKAHPVPVRAMPCSHTFHEHCIFEWLRRNAVCPLCRHQLSTEDDHEQEQEQGRRRRRRIMNFRIPYLYIDEDGQPHYGSSDDEEEEEEEVDPEQFEAALREFYAGLDQTIRPQS
uniref:RING-type domain-containing protein n=1 Tax=Setaria italica TaxID=4555 RepID=K3ZLT5_SETIT